MYSALILLAVGTLLKHPTTFGAILALLSTGFLVITAKVEEGENIIYFGQEYKNYIEKSKHFFPFIL